MNSNIAQNTIWVWKKTWAGLKRSWDEETSSYKHWITLEQQKQIGIFLEIKRETIKELWGTEIKALNQLFYWCDYPLKHGYINVSTFFWNSLRVKPCLQELFEKKNQCCGEGRSAKKEWLLSLWPGCLTTSLYHWGHGWQPVTSFGFSAASSRHWGQPGVWAAQPLVWIFNFLCLSSHSSPFFLILAIWHELLIEDLLGTTRYGQNCLWTLVQSWCVEFCDRVDLIPYVRSSKKMVWFRAFGKRLLRRQGMCQSMIICISLQWKQMLSLALWAYFVPFQISYLNWSLYWQKAWRENNWPISAVRVSE